MILLQDKQQKPQEYFVYCKDSVVQNCGRSAGSGVRDVFDVRLKEKSNRFVKRSDSGNNIIRYIAALLR